MNRLFRLIAAAAPYLAAEAIQYFIYSVILLINNFIDISDAVLYILSAGIIAVCGIIFFFWYRFEIRGEVRGSLHKLFTAGNINLFLLLGIGCQLFFTGAMTLIKPLFTRAFSEYSDIIENLTTGNEIVMLLLLIIIAPVTEELIFRGVTLHRASRYFNFFWANILQAVLFAIYHGNVIQGAYAMLLGFLLGIVYYNFKTIFAPILLHMIINASSLLVVLIPDFYISYVVITIVGGVFIALAFCGIFRDRKILKNMLR